MNLPTGLKHFYIYDYFLDGCFLKWEEVHEECLPSKGETRELRTGGGQSISAKVLGTEPLSESEYRIFLVSIG
jgi:hypothetical protein